jgi:DNA-binding NtrC family response regulator
VLERSELQNLVGPGEAMRRIHDAISQVADSRIHVIVCGDSGAGKELVARAIVGLSSRWNKPFISLNCAACPRM